jgi:uncharacterized protein YdhG (YjbR/CyaY superfamily)
MARTRITTVTDYLAAQPPEVQRLLARVRSTIRKALPDAEGTISYGIPTYKRQGRVVIYFAGWREHFAIYPSSTALAAAFERELAGHAISKGTIRFRYDDGVPVALITRLAKFRAREAGAGKRKTAAKKR